MRVTTLKKVQYKYNYDRIQYPVSYSDIAVFEEQNQVCIYEYEISESNNKINAPKKEIVDI